MKFSDQHVYQIDENTTEYHFPKPIWSSSVGRGKAKYEILELFCGLDIETTTITTLEGDHQAFAYHFQFSIGTPRVLNVYLFRKWEAILNFIDALADHYKLNEKRHMVVAIANFSFEFAFFRRRLQWDEGEWDFFAKERLQPLKATYRGIEFREVLSITGGSLAQLAKDYCHTQKLVTIDDKGVKHSDLDYTKLRNSSTYMDDQELAYCINDVVILSEFMWYLFNDFIRPEHYVPMTFTGILGREIKAELKTLCFQRDDKLGLKHGTSYDTWTDFIRSLQPTQDNYELFFKYLFRGGYVHGNAAYTGITMPAHMRDVTSHYPARMNLSYYPMSKFEELDLMQFKTLKEQLQYVQKLCRTKCVILEVDFDYIRTKYSHSIESKNKIVKYSNAKWDNGRLISADLITVWITELDAEIYSLFHTAAGMTIKTCLYADRGKLPPYLLKVLNRHYMKKEDLKRRGLNETMEYTIEKSRVNTAYGYTVKRIRLEKVLYTNELEWHNSEVPVDYDKEISKAITSPFWGIWVCSAARNELLKIMHKLTVAGVPVYYGDTDSLKYFPCHKAEQIFKHYNATIYRHRKNRKLRSVFFDGLGEFDKEGWSKDEKGKKIKWEIVQFKTLGSKRYIYALQGKVYATVAGMPKASIYQLGKTPEEVVSEFKMTGYHLTPEESGKLTTQYTDEAYSAEIDGEVMTELSGVALYTIPFTLNITSEYLQHVTQLQYEMKREEALL